MCFYLENLASLPTALSLCFFRSSPQGSKDSIFRGWSPSRPPLSLVWVSAVRAPSLRKAVCRAVEEVGQQLEGLGCTGSQVGLPQTQICLCLSPACRALTHLCPTASCGTPSPTDWIESTRCSATSLLLRQSKCQCHFL